MNKKKLIYISIFVIKVVLSLILFFVLPISGIYKILIFGSYLYISHLFSDRPFRKKNAIIRMWFGVPGSGKTTMAAFLSKKAQDRGESVYSNVDIKGNYVLDPVSDLGVYSFWNDGSGAEIIVDEASIDFDNRNYKDFNSNLKKFFALHRHEQCAVDVFSQAVDVDKKIRDRAACAFYLQPTLIRGFVKYRKIKKMMSINEEHQLVDGFDFVPLSMHLVYSRPLWKMFNTLDRSMCPTRVKKWQKWGEEPIVDDKPLDLSSLKL